MIKTRGAGGEVHVTFELDPAVDARSAALCGDFNGWSGDAHPMERSVDGSFRVTLELESGRAYRFRYLLDSSRWENDWAADAYVPNDYGGDDSVVDLVALAEAVPQVATSSAEPKKAPVKKAAAKKAPEKKAPDNKAETAAKAGAPTKKTTPVKKAADGAAAAAQKAVGATKKAASKKSRP